MSGTFPSLPVPRSCQITTFTPTMVSESWSMRRQARSRAAHRWSFLLRYPPMERANAVSLFAFLAAQRGQYETFQFVLPPPLNTPRGTGAVGSPNPYVQLTGSPTASYTGSTPTTRGWPATTAVLKAGDFVKFGSHSKVYMQTEDLTSDGTGQGVLALNTPVITSLQQGDQIVTTDIPFTVALAGDRETMEWGEGHIFNGFELELVEAF